MPSTEQPELYDLGSKTPGCLGLAPQLCVVFVLALGATGCGNDDEQRTLEPARVAMNESVTPVYEDDELTIYEAKAPFQLPIAAPDRESQRALREQGTDPYGAQPWVLNDQVEVQISWAISNLDAETHNVQLIIDPWNEFGRYWPGVTLIDEEEGEYAANLSGWQRLMEIPGVDEPGEARVYGVITYASLREVAIDFATVMNIIENPPPEDDDGAPGLATLVNHAWDIHNHSDDDPLVRQYVPDVIAGLTGFDFGLRTFEPVNMSLEIVVEVVDTGDQRVLEEGSSDPALEMPETQITISD